MIGYLLEFEKASPLKMLYLSDTSFPGELPTSIGRLGSLTKWDVSSYNFIGLIPSSLGYLSRLSNLDLTGNQFSKPNLSSLANLTQLTVLSLTLSDQIPYCLMNLSQLT